MMSLRKETVFMDYKNKIIELAEKNNEYIRTKEIISNNIPKNYLKELVDENKLKKINKGLYMLADCFEDEYFIFQSTNSDAIFSLEIALYLHNYSDRVPTIYNITVPRNYGGNLRKEKNSCMHIFYLNWYYELHDYFDKLHETYNNNTQNM